MERAVLKRFSILIILVLLLCSGVSWFFINAVLTGQTQTDMLYTLRLLDNSLDYTQPLQLQIEYLNGITLTNDTRISLIQLDGTVVADTGVDSVSVLENHADREEIRQAVSGGRGVAKRRSETTGLDMLYTAYRSEKSDYIVRLAIPFQTYTEFVGILLPALLVSVLVAFVAAMVLARRFSRSVTEPLKEIAGEFSKINERSFTFKDYRYDELNEISRAAQNLSEGIDTAKRSLSYERNKVDYILENMEEGLILLDRDGNVISINGAARTILHSPPVQGGRNILYFTTNLHIVDGIKAAVELGEPVAFDMETDDHRIYSVHISKIRKGIFDKNTSGAIVLLIDVSAERRAQQLRQEFFSNASHELKTPITSIQGYSELLESGIVSDTAQQQEFLARIKQEIGNINNLINDILEISRLESKLSEEGKSAVDIKSVIQEAVDSFLPMAKKRNIQIDVSCEPVILQAIPKHMQQLVTNLLSNAVKYNKDGGNVQITAREENGQFVLMVHDTGIGIPPYARERIFERFYRVDKGRSRKMGGTGLGLSIVKHIVNYYGGTIRVDSVLDRYTDIEVRWPISK